MEVRSLFEGCRRGDSDSLGSGGRRLWLDVLPVGRRTRRIPAGNRSVLNPRSATSATGSDARELADDVAGRRVLARVELRGLHMVLSACRTVS